MLRESEQQLSLALEGSQLALFDWNIATGEVFMSEQWAVMLGGKPAPTHTTFAALTELVHPEDIAQLGLSDSRCAQGGDAYYRVEHRVRRTTGDGSGSRVTGRSPRVIIATAAPCA